jgi:hypothetical protein
MTEPGERRLDTAPPSREARDETSRPTGTWSPVLALIVALGVALVTAIAWAILRSVLDITVGSLVVTAFGGWGIGAALRRGGISPVVAAGLAVAAWVAAMLLAWLVAMAILPGSDRSLGERLWATPFLDWLTPQLGIVEVGALIVAVGAALLASRPGGARAT